MKKNVILHMKSVPVIQLQMDAQKDLVEHLKALLENGRIR